MTKLIQNNALSLLLAAILLACTATWQADAERYSSMGPTVVATVDLSMVMAGLAERADLQAELATKGQSIQAEQKRRSEEVQQLTKDLEDIVDEQRRTTLQEELDLKILQQMAWLRFTQQEIDIDKSLMMEAIYQKMQKAAMELAQIEGIDLILIDDASKGFQIIASNQVSREEQVGQQIATRRVFWREASIDISDELIVRMNNDYAASTGSR